MYRIGLNLGLLNSLTIDLFLMRLVIEIFFFLMFTYVAFLAFLWIFAHIGANGKFIWKRLKIEFSALTNFHLTFILLLYTFTFIFNHAVLFMLWDSLCIYFLVITVNYLFLNIIYHAYSTGLGGDISTWYGVKKNECLFLVIFLALYWIY